MSKNPTDFDWDFSKMTIEDFFAAMTVALDPVLRTQNACEDLLCSETGEPPARGSREWTSARQKTMDMFELDEISAERLMRDSVEARELRHDAWALINEERGGGTSDREIIEKLWSELEIEPAYARALVCSFYQVQAKGAD